MKKVFALLLLTIIFLFSKLPIAFLYKLSDIGFVFIYYIFRYRRKVVFENLKQSFPEKSNIDIHIIERKFYKHFCDIGIESIKNLSGDKETITKRVNFKNIELLQKLYAQEKSIILYASHYGNWEWLAVLPLYVSYRMIAFYQPLSNSTFDKLIKDSREKYGIVAVPSGKAFKALKEYSDKQELTLALVLGDQSPPANGPKVWLEFLNQETAFLPGANKIAKRLEHVVVYPYFSKTSRGYYEIEFKVIQPDRDDKRDNPIIQNYAEQLENNIIEDPGLWLWSHRCWKLNKTEDR